MGKENKKKRAQLVGLFTAAILAATTATGCADKDNTVEYCLDVDRDGRCDDDGSRYDSNSYVIIDGKLKGYIKYDSKYNSGSGKNKSGSGKYKSGSGG